MRSEVEDEFLVEDPDVPRSGMFRRLMNRILNKSPPPPPPPTIIYGQGDQPQSCFRCGCCGVSLIFIVLLLALAMLITSYSLWSQVANASTSFTGMATRLFGLQNHYTFTSFTASTGGGEVSQTSLGIASSPSVGILHGWFDLHAQRTDWEVLLFQDTAGLFLSPNPSGQFYLWAKVFNTSTHTLDHVAGSPWNLGAVRTGSKTGDDIPAFIRNPPAKQPLFLWFVVQSSQALWSTPLHSVYSG